MHLKPNAPEQPHQHRWRARAVVQTQTLDRNDLVMDFQLLAHLLRQAARPLTRVKMINELPPFARRNPSAERIAQYIFDRLAPLLPSTVKLKKVIVWETPHAAAAYQP
ncbi:MAG: hypothetical protein AMJ79_06480 [Phycisphaerae bacterium SM23_30]|nr:MAG: hypothetical protein AMJ79_06480 [Phycisphaerae bacterium SM23_30]